MLLLLGAQPPSYACKMLRLWRRRTLIVETTRPRVVRVVRPVCVCVVWGRGRLARGKDTMIVET